MLFVLTGAIQIGKSRWLEALVRRLATTGQVCYGVISAGIWVPSTNEHANEQGFEKLGIESILLPQLERFEFAKRNDIAREAGSFDAHNQAAKAKLGWHISEEALARVNEHFAGIAHLCAQYAPCAQSVQKMQDAQSAQRIQGAQGAHGAHGTQHPHNVAPGLLVVDELGMLELDHDGGFTEAVKLLDAGPNALLPCALVVARSGLEQKAAARFGDAWGATQFIGPNESAYTLIAGYRQDQLNRSAM